MIPQTYTTKAYFPRSSPLSASVNHLDIVYNVYKSPDRGVPSANQVSFLFANGVQMVKEVWNYQIELLFEHYGPKIDRIITVDALNAGDSAVLNKDRIGWYHTWEDLAKDHLKVVEEVVFREPIPGALIAVGHSMGGAEVLFMTSRSPSLFAGAVLMDPVWGPDNIFALPQAVAVSRKLCAGAYRRAKQEFPDHKSYSEFIDKGYVCNAFHPRIKADMKKYCAIEDNGKFLMKASRELQAGAYAGVRSLKDHSITTFAYIPIPVLVMNGDDESWNGPGSNEKLVEMLPRGEPLVIENGGHMVFFERPEQTMELMYPFLDRITGEYQEKLKNSAATTFGEWIESPKQKL